MNLRRYPSNFATRNQSAFTLIECLVYIGLFAILLAVATSALYHCYDHMRFLRRNADEITRALHVGELWRADVRQAIQPPSLDETTHTLHIQHKDGSIDYRFSEAQVLRRIAGNAEWSSILTNLNQSQIRPEQIRGIIAWRWELELKPLHKPARVQPLFSFTAIPESTFAP